MKTNGLLAQLIVNEIRKETTFEDVTFTMNYELTTKPIPLTNPIVTITVKGCEISEADETYMRTINTIVGVDIYLPYSDANAKGYYLFDQIATYLVFQKGYPITKVVCGDLVYDKSCQAVVMHSEFIFKNKTNH